MKKKSLLWAVVAAGVLIAGVAGAVLKRESDTATTSTAASVVQPAPVLEFLASDVTTASIGELRQVLPLTGTLRALNQASVKARVGGEVREVLVREGEAVRAGQVLIRMDTSDYQARADQARGALSAARGQVNIAAKARDNNKALLDKGFISQNAFDNAQSQFEIARANLDSARGALDVAQKALGDTVIRAPISGLVASRMVQPGEKVSPDNRLLELVDLDQMELEAAVPASEITHVSLGQDVIVTVEGMPQTFVGSVARINPGTQTGSRSILTYIRIANPQGALRAGMFGQAQLTLTRKTDILTLPQSAIRSEGGQSFVYAIEDGKLVQKPVTLGLRGAGGEGVAVEVAGGLTRGAQVIRTNLGALRSGTVVRFAPSAAANKTPSETATAPAVAASARQ